MIKLELQTKRVITAGAVALGIGILAMGNGVSAASKTITINQIKNTSVGATGTVKNAKKKIVTITIDGKKYKGKTDRKGKYYIKIRKKPTVGAKGKVTCRGKKKTLTFDVIKDTTLQVTNVSKQINKNYFTKETKNGNLKQYGPGYGITNQYDQIKGKAFGKNTGKKKIYYTFSGVKGMKEAKVSKNGNFTIKRNFQTWKPGKKSSVTYTKMDCTQRTVNIYVCAGTNKNKKLYHIAKKTVIKDKHDKVMYKAGIDYAWIITQFNQIVNSGRYSEWNGIKAYACDQTYKECFGEQFTNAQKDKDWSNNSAMNYLGKSSGYSITGWDANASPENYVYTERSYAEHWKGKTFEKCHQEKAVMLVYRGFRDEGGTCGNGNGENESCFTYYFAR